MKINDGDFVRINKGAVVKSCHPSKQEYTLKRSPQIQVNHQHDYAEDTVVWAGTGGYWCWTDKSNVCAIIVDVVCPRCGKEGKIQVSIKNIGKIAFARCPDCGLVYDDSYFNAEMQ